jgi:peptide/nickel transport system permease protein
MLKIAPGDPVKNMLGIEQVTVTQQQLDALREDLGLNDPIIVQYGKWLLRVARLDLGNSYLTNKPVVDSIAAAFPATLALTASALLVTVLISLPLGILSALYKNSLIDRLANVFSLLGTSIPLFWSGLLLISLFSVKLGILPSMGIGSIRNLILPSLTLVISISPQYVKLLRASILESKDKEFVRAARARGIGEVRIFVFHILRDCLLPVITVFGLSMGNLLGGTVVIEVLFGYPGLGKLVIDAIMRSDYTVVQGFLLFIGVVVFIINVVLDYLYRVINPAIAIKGADQC